MKSHSSAPLSLALTLTLTLAASARAELQPRKVPAAPAPATTPAAPAPASAPGTAPTPAPATPPAAAAAPAVDSEGEPKLSPELSAKLLKQLDDVEKTLGGKRGGESTAMIKLLKEAGASNEKAYRLYEDCQKEIEFEQKGKTATEFVEWKRTKGKELAVNDGFCASIRLQAQFMALALLESHAETPAERANVMSEANAYLEALSKICERQEGLAKSILASIMDISLNPDHEVTMGNLEESLKQVREASAALGGNIMDSMLAKKLKPESCLGEHEPSARNPGNLDEIYEKLVMKYLREKKDAAALASAWTKRIAQVAAIAKDTKVKELSQRFETEKLPVLKWLQARDQWRCGQMESAAANMLAIIRANPGHAECQEWTKELRALATPE